MQGGNPSRSFFALYLSISGRKSASVGPGLSACFEVLMNSTSMCFLFGTSYAALMLLTGCASSQSEHTKGTLTPSEDRAGNAVSSTAVSSPKVARPEPVTGTWVLKGDSFSMTFHPDGTVTSTEDSQIQKRVTTCQKNGSSIQGRTAGWRQTDAGYEVDVYGLEVDEQTDGTMTCTWREKGIRKVEVDGHVLRLVSGQGTIELERVKD